MRQFSIFTLLLVPMAVHADADLIIHNGKVITVDAAFSISEAVAIKDGKILATGNDGEILKHQGEKTRLIDADGKVVMPGLMDSHTHPLGAALSEWKEPLPDLHSLKSVFDYITQKTKTTPEGEWIVVRYAFPTRLDEGRFPTIAELDQIAPKHPVLYHAGPAGICNSMALKVSGVTKDTPSPVGGILVKDAVTGEPTGMLRAAYGVLKGVPTDAGAKTADKLSALKKLFHLYNEQGLTSVADRDCPRETLDLYRLLKKDDDLTVRLNIARSFSSGGTREQIIKQMDALPGEDKLGGPTGVGDDFIRIGPIKLYLDGGMLNGTAYMRQPWPMGAYLPSCRRGLPRLAVHSTGTVNDDSGGSHQTQMADDRPHRRRRRYGCPA